MAPQSECVARQSVLLRTCSRIVTFTPGAGVHACCRPSVCELSMLHAVQTTVGLPQQRVLFMSQGQLQMLRWQQRWRFIKRMPQVHLGTPHRHSWHSSYPGNHVNVRAAVVGNAICTWSSHAQLVVAEPCHELSYTYVLALVYGIEARTATG